MNNSTNRFTVCLYKSLKEIILFHMTKLFILNGVIWNSHLIIFLCNNDCYARFIGAYLLFCAAKIVLFGKYRFMPWNYPMGQLKCGLLFKSLFHCP